MRQIGSFTDKSLTERFVDYLRTQDISATFETDENEWVIWVRDENQLDVAREALQQFEADPNADTYRSVQPQAAELRAAESKKRRDAKKNIVEMSGTWNAPLSKKAPLVMAMIITCIGLTVLGGVSGNMVDRWFMFADLANPAVRAGDGLFNIRAGQVWRLVTPIFLHGGIMHLLFNMYWLYYLGTQIESKKGKWKFVGLVLATGIFSNVLQYSLSGPYFLGMSGVVFGIFGYIWMRMKHDPASGYQLSQLTVIIFFIVLVIGFAGVNIGGHAVANWAHAGGLGSGVILALLPEWLSQKRRAG